MNTIPITTQSICLPTFLSSKGLNGKFTCPCSNTHTTKTIPNECSINTKVADNFIILGLTGCFHSSCVEPRGEWLRNLNKEWGKYLRDNYNRPEHKPTDEERYEMWANEVRRDIELGRIEQMKWERQQMILNARFNFWGSVKMSNPPPPINVSPQSDYEMFKSLFNSEDLIFVGSQYSTEIRYTKDCQYRTNDNFVCGNVFTTTDGRTAENTLYQKYLILEHDKEDKNRQWSYLQYFHTRISPIQMIVDTGGKSLHGWIHCPTTQECRDLMKDILCDGLGYDPATFKRIQIVRCPGSYREEKQKYQRLLFFNKTLPPINQVVYNRLMGLTYKW